MSVELSNSPTNKSSLATWWKTFKKKNALPSMDSHHHQQAHPYQNQHLHQQAALQNHEDALQMDNDTFDQLAQDKSAHAQVPAASYAPQVAPRPILRYKSRSSNYIRPISPASNFSPSSSESLKAQRDSFLQSQRAKNNNDSQVFGVSLEKALSLASVNISISEDLANEGIQYGAIPVVVGKCCVYLKKNGTEVEGIFRVGGASRRVKELQFIFSTPPDYGRRLDWEGYTVHDAASLLRRFLNSLEEPLIPLALYEQFREPLQSRPAILRFLSKKGVAKKTSSSSPTAEKTQGATTVSEPSGPTLPEIITTTTTPITTNVQLENNSIVTDEVVEKALDNVDDDERGNENDDNETANDNTNTNANDDNDDSNNNANKLSEEQQAKRQRKIKKYKRLIREIHSALKEYSILLNKLPSSNQHLLFYILDLLTVFASHSDKNLMSNKNLAAIFQPSILSHPNHDMSPEEYALSAQVVEFLLEYYRRLLEATQKNKLEVQSQQQFQQQQNGPPALQITTDADIDSLKKGGGGYDTDQSANTPVTPSSNSLHPPISKRATRKHSKSLSSVNAPPDGLKYSAIPKEDDKVILQPYNSNTDAEDSEGDIGDKTPSRNVLTMDHGNDDVEDMQLFSPPQKPFSPTHNNNNSNKKVGGVESLGAPPSLMVPSSAASGSATSTSATASNSSGNNSLFQNFKRPLSAVFLNKEKNASIEDILQHQQDTPEASDRATRWDENEQHHYHQHQKKEKDNWLTRLRSRSRSSEPRQAISP